MELNKKTYVPDMLSELDKATSLEDILEVTDKMESKFLKLKNARQWWHATAYLKLKTNEDKKVYRDEYGLSAKLINVWVITVRNIQENLNILPLAQDHRLNFSHSEAIAPLVGYDPTEAKALYEQAIAGRKNKKGEYRPLTASVIKTRATKALANYVTPDPEPTVWEVCQVEALRMDDLLVKVQMCAQNISKSLSSDKKIKTKLADMGLAERFIFCAQKLVESAHTIDAAKSKKLLGDK